VRQPTSVAIWAAGGVVQTAHLVLLPPIGLTASSATVKGGDSVKLTVVLPAPAPAEGARIGVSSSHPAVSSTPIVLPVTSGLIYGSTTLRTERVTQPTTVTFSASYGGQSWRAVVTVVP